MLQVQNPVAGLFPSPARDFVSNRKCLIYLWCLQLKDANDSHY